MVKKLCLNGAKLTDEESFHTYFQRLFAFPDYYGGNLDALQDCLSDGFGLPAQLIWCDYQTSCDLLGEFVRKVDAILNQIESLEVIRFDSSGQQTQAASVYHEEW